MGAVPSREVPKPLYSLRYGTHEIGLIPFTRANFGFPPQEGSKAQDGESHDESESHSTLRRQFVALRNDPGVLYYQLRPHGFPLSEVPPPSYTEKNLEEELDAVEKSLFDTNESFLSAFEKETTSEMKAAGGTIIPADTEDMENSETLSPSPAPINSILDHLSSESEEDFPPSSSSVEKSEKYVTASPSDPHGSFKKGGDLGNKNSAEVARLRRIQQALLPVPCVIVFTYASSVDKFDCFYFQGRKANVIGFINLWPDGKLRNEIKEDYTMLELHKAVLKAAGDRTIERALMLATTLYYDQLSLILSIHRPAISNRRAIEERLHFLDLKATCMWNNYPSLKLFYDSVAFFYATEELNAKSCPAEISLLENELHQKQIEVILRGPLLCRLWSFMALHQLRQVSRTAFWIHFSLSKETHSQKKAVDVFLAGPEVESFFNGKELSEIVRSRLIELHREIVCARKAPQDDLSLWSDRSVWSHDGKQYRVYLSPACGSFLTTVKNFEKEIKNKKHSDDSESGGLNSRSGDHENSKSTTKNLEQEKKSGRGGKDKGSRHSELSGLSHHPSRAQWYPGSLPHPQMPEYSSRNTNNSSMPSHNTMSTVGHTLSIQIPPVEPNLYHSHSISNSGFSMPMVYPAPNCSEGEPFSVPTSPSDCKPHSVASHMGASAQGSVPSTPNGFFQVVNASQRGNRFLLSVPSQMPNPPPQPQQAMYNPGGYTPIMTPTHMGMPNQAPSGGIQRPASFVTPTGVGVSPNGYIAPSFVNQPQSCPSSPFYILVPSPSGNERVDPNQQPRYPYTNNPSGSPINVENTPQKRESWQHINSNQDGSHPMPQTMPYTFSPCNPPGNPSQPSNINGSMMCATNPNSFQAQQGYVNNVAVDNSFSVNAPGQYTDSAAAVDKNIEPSKFNGSPQTSIFTSFYQ